MRHWHDHFWRYGQDWGHGHAWASGGPPMLLSTLFWIALLIILAGLLIYWLLPRVLPQDWLQNDTPSAQSSALEILRQRYARGEIDAMTFEQMRERLEASYHQNYPQPPGMWMEEQYTRWRVKD